MRFDLEHRFPAGLGAVEAAMFDPAFVEGLVLPDVAPLKVVLREESGPQIVLRVRYEYTGHLDALARRVVSADDLSWDQEVTYDRPSHRGTFEIIPDTQAGRLSCSGTYRLGEVSGATERTITADLRVRVPLISGRAEKAIGGGLVRRLEVEARLLEEWLARSNG